MEMTCPILQPVTPEAREALQRDEIILREFPFRVGRESRFGLVKGKLRSMERRKREAPPNNDLYLIDRGELLNISREHFQIERTEDGGYEMFDRGSTCGTIVDDHPLGGGAESVRCPLKDGSTIRIGTGDSPYIFVFRAPVRDSPRA